MSWIPVLAGAVFGIGALAVVATLRGVDPATLLGIGTGSVRRASEAGLPGSHRPSSQRVAGAIAAAIAVGLLSRWPVGVIGGAAAGAAAPTLASARKRRRETMARVEAVATWCEQLRDIIGASSGLQEAIAASSRVAPGPIREAVRDFAVDQRRRSFAVAAHRFANAVDDPVGDQVAIALTLAAERRGQSLAAVLDDVASAAREEATMLDRTETTRARSYNEALAVTGIVLTMFGGLLLFNRAYLEPFDSLVGQVVLATIGLGWAAAFASLVKLSEVVRPERLLRVGGGSVSAPAEAGARQ